MNALNRIRARLLVCSPQNLPARWIGGIPIDVSKRQGRGVGNGRVTVDTLQKHGTIANHPIEIPARQEVPFGPDFDGRWMRKVVPNPGALSVSIVQPSRSQIRLTR
jgi:hypothetical protein